MNDLSDMLRLAITEANMRDPYNGCCRTCYAFKGQYGGECVDSDCTCHTPKGSHVDVLDASDLDVIRRSLELRYSILYDEPTEADLPALSDIIRVQAKLDAIGKGGTFVAIPF